MRALAFSATLAMPAMAIRATMVMVLVVMMLSVSMTVAVIAHRTISAVANANNLLSSTDIVPPQAHNHKRVWCRIDWPAPRDGRVAPRPRTSFRFLSPHTRQAIFGLRACLLFVAPQFSRETCASIPARVGNLLLPACVTGMTPRSSRLRHKPSRADGIWMNCERRNRALIVEFAAALRWHNEKGKLLAPDRDSPVRRTPHARLCKRTGGPMSARSTETGC